MYNEHSKPVFWYSIVRKMFCIKFYHQEISVDLKDEGNQSIQIKTLAYKTSNLEAKKGIISKST